MFGLFKDNKPEIQKQIKKAIIEEKKYLESIKKDISIKLSKGEDIDLNEYNVNLMIKNYSNCIYKKENLTIDNVSSREMFQALNKICPDAEYNVDDDTVTGTVKGHTIFMMRHKFLRNYYISVSATILDIHEHIQQYINEYKRQEESEKIPEFIKNIIGD